jgi:SAM-dependent methyltransferase
MPARPSLTLDECLEWRQLDWLSPTEAALDAASPYLRSNSNVLELGYRSGLMACYLASHYGVRVTGYDINMEVLGIARRNAERFGLSERVDFRVCSPAETLSLRGSYDAVFVKSVLASVGHSYDDWLEWIASVLRPGGVLIAVENGPGTSAVRLARLVRKWLGAYYAPSPLDSHRLESFSKYFEVLSIRCSGQWAPLFGGAPPLWRAVSRFERIVPVGPSRSFVTSVVARRL